MPIIKSINIIKNNNFHILNNVIRYYTTINNDSFNNTLVSEFPNIEIKYSNNDKPLYYTLQKEKELEIPRIGCNPLKRLDRNLTRPVKQLLILDQLNSNNNNNHNNNNNNNNNIIALIKEIRNLKLDIDINAAITTSELNNEQLIDIINTLPKTPILISLANESSNNILQFLENNSNPLFPFTILKLNNSNQIKKLRNFTDIYIIKEELNNNNLNNQNNNNNIKETIVTNNINNSIIKILNKELE